MNKVLRILTALPAVMFLATSVRWLIDPAGAAATRVFLGAAFGSGAGALARTGFFIGGGCLSFAFEGNLRLRSAGAFSLLGNGATRDFRTGGARPFAADFTPAGTSTRFTV
ncbi:MAG: hypothetical protein IH801_06630 [Nitrospinae bacterium]|nr:hypothetical protein [Nitrospinota bacterium]